MVGIFSASRFAPSNQGRPSAAAALDLGSSKVACLIARPEPGAAVDVLGYGHATSTGVRAGGVVDVAETAAAIRSAVDQAEKMAGQSVSRVTVGFSGGQLRAHRLAGETGLEDRPVDDRDLRRALDAALSGLAAPDQAVLHAIPIAWTIDHHRGVRDPRGMYGRRLAVDLNAVTAAVGPVRNVALCVEQAGLELRAVVAAPYAAGLSALTREEMELGCTVLDLGAGVTSAAVFLEGALAHVEVIGLGGALVTSDIARVLSAPLSGAERIKRVHGGVAEDADDRGLMVTVPLIGEEGGAVQVPRRVIASMIRARVEETLERLRDRLMAAGMLDAAGRRVVLVGGGAQLPGIDELAGRILGKQASLGRPLKLAGAPPDASGPAGAVAAGLLRQLVLGPREIAPPHGRRDTQPRRRAVGERGLAQAAQWLRENF